MRIKTGAVETDRVLGGGIVPGSLVLLGGDPGIGKSTLVLQIASSLSKSNKKVLYVSGEESPNQIKIRSDRLGTDVNNIFVLGETEINSIIQSTASFKPDVLIVDSIQTVYAAELSSAPGNVSQISYITNKLLEFAKKNNVATFIIGHVTKEGNIAGPRVLEHLVDVVLYLEGDRYGHFRVLRGVKNRFGSTNEAGIFEMAEKGLNEVQNPSLALLSQKSNSPGSIVFPAMEGTRPILVEVQALTSTTPFGYPARKTSGFDTNRLQLLATVLQKRAGVDLSNQDIYVNIIGGMTLKEPALDLPVCLSIVSAFKNKEIPSDIVAFGEIGLSGEIRGVNNIEKRVLEAEKLGFKKGIIGAGQNAVKSNLKIFTPKTITEAFRYAFRD
ncbi:MAG: repair protein radA protein [candidate division CPR2 bacterium GW2011_GWC1_41_48]|uniref:DNA repair protein RadA n=1 Tax=candidate division CPR2 bacterium GW2011_GWC1_41_48 TaxID=1618344 RepID=A0A0G0W750_UNCC2|nr:MAG: repair protein radA protein [candidate division CPR2 bacterium GW2011_GWC2_39_35]KKR27113.1 MAG: repair protein radA protein [candidate division CPR2 bacterium GW2011_GWD1_39_7]KKR28663.1 MAG: repair protein radA protein [candidate division CPR2 bacterium GW2011_GWD2_39_7]KKS08804.1 MAG: repair protein radA protein [candidate division CPR2 bacterium GW2011_GWC1_41_48]